MSMLAKKLPIKESETLIYKLLRPLFAAIFYKGCELRKRSMKQNFHYAGIYI